MIRKYIESITDFIEGRVDAESFEHAFLKMFKNEETIFPEEIYYILGSFFSDVETFVSDDSIRDEDNGDLDEAQLRESARKTLESLDELV